MTDSLLYYFEYYLNVLIALCGFDGSAGNDVVGWVVVLTGLSLVSAAIYIGISRAIWPGEKDPTHIKYSILDDTGEDGDEGGLPNAH